jgi:hypothetical protein
LYFCVKFQRTVPPTFPGSTFVGCFRELSHLHLYFQALLLCSRICRSTFALLFALLLTGYCGYTPCRPSNSIFAFSWSTSGYTFTHCVESFACPGIDTQVEKASPQHVTHLPPCVESIACPGIDTRVEKASPQHITHLPPCVESFACPGIDTQVQGISVLRLIQRTRQSK